MKSAIVGINVLAVLLVIASCGGESTLTGTDGGGGGGAVARSIKVDPSLSSDIREIFVSRGCTSLGCHGGGEGGLTLTTAASMYANLVNVSSSTGEIYVIPGDATQSYLVKRLDGRVNPQMPLNRTPLDNIDLTNVRNWVNQGAKNN